MVIKFMMTAPAAENWSVAGIFIAGLIMMAVARLWLRSPFFSVQREADAG
jgi:hypothetical protein